MGSLITTLSAATRTTLRAILYACLGLVLIMGAMALLQNRLLYFPQAASVAEILAATGRAQVTAWPTAHDFRGVASVVPDAFGSVVVFHGNAGHAGHRGHYIEQFNKLGLRVILAEYPGYGARQGSLGEESLAADAAATLALVRREFGDPVYVVGESLGAGVASSAVGIALQHGEKIGGLLLITPWDTLANVAAYHYPWLPVRWMLVDKYDSAANLVAFVGPSIVALAAQDEVIPARFGQALFAALGGRKQLAVIDGATHNDWPELVGAGWWQSVVEAWGISLASPS